MEVVPTSRRTHVSPDSTATASWTDPGLFTVAPGVHRVPLTESREALAGALATLGCGLGDVRHFLVTHVHRDHYTQAVELRRIFGSKVSLGAGEHEAIRAILAGGARPFEPQLRQLQASGADVVLERLRELGA